MHQQRLYRRHKPGIATIARRHQHITQKPYMAGPAHRSAGKHLAKSAVIQRQQMRQRRHVGRAMELRLGSAGRIFVPGTDRQAVIAPENPVAHGRAVFRRDLALMFDCQIGNTAACVQTIRRGKGICRADIKTARAGPAMVRLNRIWWQHRICEDHAQKQP